MALIQDATGDLAFAQTLETALLNDLQANTPQGVNSKVALSIRAGDCKTRSNIGPQKRLRVAVVAG